MGQNFVWVGQARIWVGHGLPGLIARTASATEQINKLQRTDTHTQSHMRTHTGDKQTDRQTDKERNSVSER